MDNKLNEAAITKQVKTLVLQGKYEAAMDALDAVDIGKIKNISILCLAGEALMGLSRYDEAERILLRVYEKNSKTRRILDLLTTLYIEKGEYSEAEYYYKEFIGVASRDLHRYILRYRLDKSKGERSGILIDTLEKLKDYEYIEEWAYELAELYAASGEDKKCIHECDEIVLWFGHGEYVDKAIALKCRLTGQPLPEVSTVAMHEMEEISEGQPEISVESESDAEDIDLDLIRRAIGENAENELNAEDIAREVAAAVEISENDEMMGEQSEEEQPEEAEDKIVAMDEAPEIEEKNKIAKLFGSIVGSFHQSKKTESIEGVATDPDALDEEDAIWSNEALAELEAAVRFERETEVQKPVQIVEDEMIEDEDEDEIIEEPADDDEDDDEDDEIIDDDEIMTDMNTEMNLFNNIFSESASDEILVDDDDEDDEDDEIIDEDDEDEIIDEDEVIDEDEETVAIPSTVLDIFGSVGKVQSIKEQLAKTFTKFEDSALEHQDLLAEYDINFVVTGEDMNAKSQIAIGIAKALNTYGICDKSKLVRATADDLNRNQFASIFEKLKGGCLIVENADRLNESAVNIIVTYVTQAHQDVAIVLEAQEERIKELFKAFPVLRSKFLNIIHIGKYNENELVQLGKSYAEKKGYDLTAQAEAHLKAIIKERMMEGYSVNYEDIMAIIEEAISSLEKRNMKNLFMTVLDNKYKEASMFNLLDEDFDNINI